LSQLAAHLPNEHKTQAVTDALRAARAIGDEPAQTYALNSIARHLSGDLKPDPLPADDLQVHEGAWKKYLGALAPLHSDLSETEVLARALQAARNIADPEWRAYSLSNLAPRLPESDRAAVLPEAFALATRITSSRGAESRRASVLRRVVTAWHAIGFAGLEPGGARWRETLRALAANRRAELLYDITVLLPLLKHLGTAETVPGIQAAIRDMTRWWP
jgi:hypothetical protein